MSEDYEKPAPICPKCGGTEFEFQVLQTVRVDFWNPDDAGDHSVTDDPSGDIEWADDTVATCYGCDHQAPLGEMKEPE